jgi:hypothetical protein
MSYLQRPAQRFQTSIFLDNHLESDVEYDHVYNTSQFLGISKFGR